ncbi:MAG: DUF455 family protein [Myxococcales bacterium]|nr:DUF455 family protein [Myxococcales bacterium]
MVPLVEAPPEGTVESWAWSYVTTTSLAHKLHPPAVPTEWESSPPARRVPAPGRPPELRVVLRAPKTRSLATADNRARAMHTFFHHELQAAELMAWALLAFPDTPRELREGLVRIAHDEIRHMHVYREVMATLGRAPGDFEVRDWFWERVPTASTIVSFLAVMGLGVESANLEHAAAWAARFRAVGDEACARAQELVGLEEIAHVRFGARWFTHFEGSLAFDAWRRALPPPLTPLLMRGAPLARAARERAGQPAAFLDELEAWQPAPPGS